MIYQDIMNRVPDHWSPMSSDVRFRAVPLSDPYSQEYIRAKSRLEGNYFRLATGIYRIQNPLAWTKFTLKRDEYYKRGAVEIKTLFHDTSAANIDSICEFNFDWRMGERFMFGPGVYFSVKPEIAFKHSSKKNGTLRAMFIVDVLVQKVQKVYTDGIFLPDSGYDTVLAHREQTYVKYFDSEFYPQYVMTYEAPSVCFSSPDSYYNGYFYHF